MRQPHAKRPRRASLQSQIETNRGEPCRAPAVRGCRVCPMYGGSRWRADRQAERELSARSLWLARYFGTSPEFWIDMQAGPRSFKSKGGDRQADRNRSQGTRPRWSRRGWPDSVIGSQRCPSTPRVAARAPRSLILGFLSPKPGSWCAPTCTDRLHRRIEQALPEPPPQGPPFAGASEGTQ